VRVLTLWVILVAVATPAWCDWRIVPEVRVAGGDESDLVIDPGLTRTIVAGGSFTEITPALAARRWLGRQAIVDLGTFTTAQRYFNGESRLLYAHTVWGDMFQNFGKSLRGRLSGSADFFDDSAREAVRRTGAGGEVGLAFVSALWSAELWGGGRGRWYPNIEVQDRQNRLSTYTEATWSGGVKLYVSPLERINVRGDGVLQNTDSADPFFDSSSWTAFGSIDLRIVSSFFLTVSGTFQEREFAARTTGEDTDEYRQLGAGLRYTVAPGWTAAVRYGYSDYTWPDGNSEDTHRLAFGVQYVWGRRAALPPLRVDVDALTGSSAGTVQKPDDDGNVVLRVRAPGALHVGVAGDFNGWIADSTPLAPVGDGWWEARVELGPGVYEYVYIIDGKWTTPPEAKITVADGFGGLNGVLEVLPPEM
jgi:hypothetical protein